MKAISIQSQIALDGKLRLELPTGLPPGPAEVIIVLQPGVPDAPAKAPSLSGLFASEGPSEDEVMGFIRQLRHETTEASWEVE